MPKSRKVKLSAWSGDGPTAQATKTIRCPDCNSGVKIKISRDGQTEAAICPCCRLLLN